jgi:hypothetical protein
MVYLYVNHNPKLEFSNIYIYSTKLGFSFVHHRLKILVQKKNILKKKNLELILYTCIMYISGLETIYMHNDSYIP